MKQCSIENCSREVEAVRYCKLHYSRNLIHGDPNYINPSRHGKTKSPEYKVWGAIKTRCYNMTANDYYRYGGRGITMCDEWLNDFTRFLKDMGTRPTKNHSIDRINVNGNYEPSNCRWATIHEQANNRRNNLRNPGVNYNKKYRKPWAAILVINKKQVHYSRHILYESALSARHAAEVLYLGHKLNKE